MMYYGNAGWLWMTVMMLIFWGGLIAVAVWAVRAGFGSQGQGDAMDVLRRRFAAGEISEEEFQKRKQIL